MMHICKNCKTRFQGNYCNNCGQTSDTHKLDFHFIWHDVKKGLFHYDSGIFYTAKELFTRPGNTIREFIQGKRIKHFKPISLVLILATFYAFLYHTFNVGFFIQENSSADSQKFFNFITTHFSWVTLATIPLYTLGTFICFRKQGYNYVEFFILNTFKASQRLFLRIFTFPIIFYFDNSLATKKVYLAYYICDLILTYWTNSQFFNKLPHLKTLGLTLLSHLIFLIALIAVIALISLFL